MTRDALLLALSLLLTTGTGCATWTRQAYVEEHPHLDAYKMRAILDGKIAVGMTREEAEAAAGRRFGFVTSDGYRTVLSCGPYQWIIFRQGQVEGFRRF